MRKLFFRFFVAAAAMFVFAPMAKANDNAELLRRIEQLESQLNNPMSFASHNGGDVYQATGAPCCDLPQEGPSNSVYAEAQVTVLKPHAAVNNGAENDYGVGSRLIIGYDGPYGFGVRGRYWNFDQGASLGGGTGGSIKMDVLDLEAVLRGSVGCWELETSGGIRYANMQMDAQGVPFIPAPVNIRGAFEGAGLTAAFGGSRPINDTGLSLVGNLRGSLLYGDTTTPFTTAVPAPVPNPTPNNINNDMTSVWEIQLGAEWTRCVGNYELVASALWEAQIWQNTSLSNPLTASGSGLGFGSDLGFTGPTFGLGVRF